VEPYDEPDEDLAERFCAVCERLRVVERRSQWLTVLLAAAAAGGAVAAAALIGRREPKRPTVEVLRRNGVI
jgi:hypothetical protein